MYTFPGNLIIDPACKSFIAFQKYPYTSAGSKRYPGLFVEWRLGSGRVWKIKNNTSFPPWTLIALLNKANAFFLCSVNCQKRFSFTHYSPRHPTLRKPDDFDFIWEWSSRNQPPCLVPLWHHIFGEYFPPPSAPHPIYPSYCFRDWCFWHWGVNNLLRVSCQPGALTEKRDWGIQGRSIFVVFFTTSWAF